MSAATSASSAAIVPAWQITVQIGVGLSVNQAGLAIREMPRVGLLDALDFCVLVAAEAPHR